MVRERAAAGISNRIGHCPVHGDWEHPFVETQRVRRGHRFLPASVAAALPRLYATEHTPVDEKIVWARYFAGCCEWLVVEYDPVERLAFGWCDLGVGHPEWGYVDLAELEQVLVADGLVIVEREIGWQPKAFGEVRPR
jgi:hypothetical protein